MRKVTRVFSCRRHTVRVTSPRFGVLRPIRPQSIFIIGRCAKIVVLGDVYETAADCLPTRPGKVFWRCWRIGDACGIEPIELGIPVGTSPRTGCRFPVGAPGIAWSSPVQSSAHVVLSGQSIRSAPVPFNSRSGDSHAGSRPASMRSCSMPAPWCIERVRRQSVVPDVDHRPGPSPTGRVGALMVGRFAGEKLTGLGTIR